MTIKDLTKFEYITLRYLASFKEFDENATPKGLTRDQYVISLRGLRNKGLFRCTIDYNEIKELKGFTPEGASLIWEIENQEEELLMRAIFEFDILSIDGFKVLQRMNKNNIFPCGKTDIDSIDLDNIYIELKRAGFVKSGETKDDPEYILTMKGNIALQKIQMAVKDKIFGQEIPISTPQPSQNLPFKQQHVKTNIDMNQNFSKIHIAEHKQTAVIKIVWAMWKNGLFVNEAGGQLLLSDIMEPLSKVLNEPGLLDFSSKLSQSKAHSNYDSFVQSVKDLEKPLRDYFVKEKSNRDYYDT